MYLKRTARAINREKTPIKELLSDYSYAVDEILEPGYRYKLKKTDYLAAILTLSGESRYMFDKPRTIKPGGLLIIPPDVPFSEEVSDRPCHNRYIMLKGPLVDSIFSEVEHKETHWYFDLCPGLIEKTINEIVELVHRTFYPMPWELGRLLCRFAQYLHQKILIPEDEPLLKDEVMNLIRNDPAKRWSVSDVAQSLFLGESTFAHRFKEENGISPAIFIRNEKCQMARYFLEQGGSVMEVSEILGFKNPYHFSKVFTSCIGKPPSAFKHKLELKKNVTFKIP